MRDGFINQIKRGMVGAEIGVYLGEYSQRLLEKVVEKLYLIDPYNGELYKRKNVYKYIGASNWEQVEGKNYDSSVEYDWNKHLSEAKRRVVERLSGKNVVWHFLPSAEAVKLVSESLDFVYIDGHHDYKFVKQDIFKWEKKVKSNGLIGGHDYNQWGVRKAVNEYGKPNIEDSEWWFVKK